MAVAARRARTEQVGDPEDEQQRRRKAAIALLESWVNVSEEEKREQRETFELLQRFIDEDRMSDRKLFAEA